MEEEVRGVGEDQDPEVPSAGVQTAVAPDEGSIAVAPSAWEAQDSGRKFKEMIAGCAALLHLHRPGVEVLSQTAFARKCRKVHLLHLSREESPFVRKLHEMGAEAENVAAESSWTPGWAWNFLDDAHRDLLRYLVAEVWQPIFW